MVNQEEGNTTKIHTVVDNNGLPLRIILSSGNRHDIKFARELIEGFNITTVIADRGYDANWFRQMIPNPCIPGRKNRKIPIEYNEELYKSRNIIERFFQRIKRFKKIATRYEKTSQFYLSMIQIGVFIVLSRFMNVYSVQKRRNGRSIQKLYMGTYNIHIEL